MQYVYTRSRVRKTRKPNGLNSLINKLQHARLRILEQLAQTFGLVLQSQINDNHHGDDPQAQLDQGSLIKISKVDSLLLRCVNKPTICL